MAKKKKSRVTKADKTGAGKKKKAVERAAKKATKEKTKTVKPAPKKINISYDEISKWKTISAVFFVLFIVTLVWHQKPVSKTEEVSVTQQAGGDELIFITSSFCASCAQYEDTMKHIADVIGARYRKVEYINPVSFPGFVIITNNTLAITGFNDKTQLLQFVCQITSNEEICDEYNAELNKNVNKTDKPVVKFFVMSFCPFGQQMEKVMKPVYDLLKGKVIFEPHYVIYSNYGGYPSHCLDEEQKYCSMHGIQELHEDVRQLCIWKYYDSDTWWDYVMEIDSKCSSSNVDECWEDIAKSKGIDVEKIKTCLENEALDLLANEVKLNQQYDVRGSPTVFINEEVYRGERTPDAFKEAVCARFIEPPDECSNEVNGEKVKATSGSCG